MIPGVENPVLSGTTDKCSDCGVELKLEVQRSAAGYYIGTQCDCGPYSRESDYFDKRDDAQKALDAWDTTTTPPWART